MHKHPPCRGWGIGHPGLELNSDNTAVCSYCGQRLPAYKNEADLVTFSLHYPPRRSRAPDHFGATAGSSTRT